MTLTNIIPKLSEAVTSAQQLLAEINEKISNLEAERDRICKAPPHSDDIAAVLLRGLDAAGEDFKRRLGAYMNDKNATHEWASCNISEKAGQLLGIPLGMPHRDNYSLFLPFDSVYGNNPLDMSAITYFLRESIAKDIPNLVAKLCPIAKEGMKQVDRDAALAKLDNELSSLHAQRDELLSSFETVRGTVNSPDA